MQTKQRSNRRRGMTLLEVGVALVILAAAMATLVQLVGVSTRQRRANDQRSAALQEIANEAERLATIPWNDLAPEELTTWQPSAVLTSVLPAAECRVTVTEESGPPHARRLELRVAWKNAVGDQVAPVELTLWRYAPEDQP
jgi:prepilin-type N-terminal cleavage/methylation domain-containing protein